MILLTDEESRSIRDIVRYGDPYPSADREALIAERTAKAQLKKVAKGLTDILEDPAYFNHRQAKIWEYVQALLKEVE